MQYANLEGQVMNRFMAFSVWQK